MSMQTMGGHHDLRMDSLGLVGLPATQEALKPRFPFFVSLYGKGLYLFGAANDPVPPR